MLEVCFVIVSTEYVGNVCLDLVKQHKICLNEVKCTKMHSSSTKMCVRICESLSHAFKKKATNFLDSKERARVGERKTFLVSHASTVHCYKKNDFIWSVSSFVFFIHPAFVLLVSLLICSEMEGKNWIQVANKISKGKTAAKCIQRLQATTKSTSQFWSWIHTSATFFFSFWL